MDEGGSRRWVFLYRRQGRRREMGLGGTIAISLAKAREKALEARSLLEDGKDPIEFNRAIVQQQRHAATFGEIADTFIGDHAAAWRNLQHRRQWRQSLEVQAASLWCKPVAEIDTADVLVVLRPMWAAKPETARRIRGRIERVLDAARATGHRDRDNPARWKGHLSAILPKTQKLTRGHHPAMAYEDVPGFLATLRERPAASARALALLILTAARSGEVRGMTWGEVSLDDALWTVPGGRMKAKRPHSSPLSPAAVAILRDLMPEQTKPGDLVFPNSKARPHSDMVFTALLKRMGRGDVTAHGFRSSFRDWAGNETSHPREIAEAALAHLVGDEVERAYRRGDALRKRRVLMDDWSHYCAPVSQ